MIADINPGSADSYAGGFTPLNGMLLFTADDGLYGRELWVHDPVVYMTRLAADIYAGASASPRCFAAFDGRLYFAASDGQHGEEPWMLTFTRTHIYPAYLPLLTKAVVTVN